MTFRDLGAGEIDVRVQSIKVRQGVVQGAVLLLYKDARCDMNILDETVGAENWQREHYECKGNLFCRVGVRCGTDWVYKSDCGTESNTEAQKGEASDSFKRACFNWGIGRELYTAPLIWIAAGAFNAYDTGRKDKYGAPVFATGDSFSVAQIAVQDKRITQLQIRNNKTGKVCFTYSAAAKEKPLGQEIGRLAAAIAARDGLTEKEVKVRAANACKTRGDTTEGLRKILGYLETQV